MTYQYNPTDPLVLLAETANGLVNQYENKEITLEQFKNSLNSQVIPQFASVDKSSKNDDAYYKISTAIAYINAIE